MTAIERPGRTIIISTLDTCRREDLINAAFAVRSDFFHKILIEKWISGSTFYKDNNFHEETLDSSVNNGKWPNG
jgi:hypothetical protein